MQCEQSTTVFSMPIRVLQQLLIWEWKRKTHPTFFPFFLFFIVLVPLLPKKVTYQVSVRSLFCVWSKIGTLLNSLLRTTIFEFFENGVWPACSLTVNIDFSEFLSKFRFLLKMKLPLSKDSVNSRSFVKGKVFSKHTTSWEAKTIHRMNSAIINKLKNVSTFFVK